jgi:uncharacterized Fe-S cluster protein YjdI
MVKKYKKGETIVVWKPDLCQHSGICISGLPTVFKPKARPWIDIEGATEEEIRTQVQQCPSGALGIEEVLPPAGDDLITVEVRPHGPLRIKGLFRMIHPDGSEEEKKIASFCRCGHSANKPFCDGTHKSINFEP